MTCDECGHPREHHSTIDEGDCTVTSCTCDGWREPRASYPLIDYTCGDDTPSHCVICNLELPHGSPYAEQLDGVLDGTVWVVIVCVYCDLKASA